MAVVDTEYWDYVYDSGWIDGFNSGFECGVIVGVCLGFTACRIIEWIYRKIIDDIQRKRVEENEH